jgi:hypothetical protein
MRGEHYQISIAKGNQIRDECSLSAMRALWWRWVEPIDWDVLDLPLSSTSKLWIMHWFLMTLWCCNAPHRKLHEATFKTKNKGLDHGVLDPGLTTSYGDRRHPPMGSPMSFILRADPTMETHCAKAIFPIDHFASPADAHSPPPKIPTLESSRRPWRLLPSLARKCAT